jgi:hypothetical protein
MKWISARYLSSAYLFYQPKSVTQFRTAGQLQHSLTSSLSLSGILRPLSEGGSSSSTAEKSTVRLFALGSPNLTGITHIRISRYPEPVSSYGKHRYPEFECWNMVWAQSKVSSTGQKNTAMISRSIVGWHPSSTDGISALVGEKEVYGGLNIDGLLHHAIAGPREKEGCYPSHGVLGYSIAALNILMDTRGTFCHITFTCATVTCHIASRERR